MTLSGIGWASSVLGNELPTLLHWVLGKEKKKRRGGKKPLWKKNWFSSRKFPLLFLIRLCQANRRPKEEINILSIHHEFILPPLFRYWGGRVQTRTVRFWGVRGGCGRTGFHGPLLLKCIHRIHIFPDLTKTHLPVTQSTVVMIKDHRIQTFS